MNPQELYDLLKIGKLTYREISTNSSQILTLLEELVDELHKSKERNITKEVKRMTETPTPSEMKGIILSAKEFADNLGGMEPYEFYDLIVKMTETPISATALVLALLDVSRQYSARTIGPKKMDRNEVKKLIKQKKLIISHPEPETMQ